MRIGGRVLVRPLLQIPVRPWRSESYQSPFYYPGTVIEINENGRARVELDESLYPAPWGSRIQLFHTAEIHRYGCNCDECGTPGRDIYRFRADQAQRRDESQP
ncbi:hypothetical protein [Planotetraspora kaengkrachanensis]|uniref:Uncharacterized protein n=1 Tax=Planotetraspora kaengkrachanensis TaxID=575193 RepID=A0A8J3M5S3_9ACTN|nr:hypothetical protein [Planotetraspora kaengkrachanensis]GIG79974.1 hypothetical protein Pka01_31010 [Planotetraspora kaengkrachanensis]